MARWRRTGAILLILALAVWGSAFACGDGEMEMDGGMNMGTGADMGMDMDSGMSMDGGAAMDMGGLRPPEVIDLSPSEGSIDGPVFVDKNPDPAVLEVDLEASVTEVEYLPGSKTAAWAYNGTVPGPRLEASVGDRVIIHFRNSLPEPTTIHWHGLRIPAEMDGTVATQAPIQPGDTFDYDFVLRDAGTFWYHPHVRSDVQVERGLYGVIIVRGEDEPPAAAEHILVLDDVFLNDDGTFAPDSAATSMLGRQGNVILANGRPRPVVQVRTGERQRWRFVNASNARYFRLSLPGERFALIGVDGGLIEAPRELDELLLVPGERVDLLVTPTGVPGTELDLLTLPYDRGEGTGGMAAANVMHVRYSPDPPAEPGPLPAGLRSIDAPPEPVRTRPIVFSEDDMSGMEGMEPVFRINGEVFPDVTPLEARLGESEIWEIANETMMDHPFHLHGFFFQVLSRGGVPEPYRAWKDTVNVAARQTVRVAVALDGFPGTWAFHCHILEHAERGMAGLLIVSP